jgi:D-3-phosphoglycerate dehydrogenase / 2-oxoglutarate reductase
MMADFNAALVAMDGHDVPEWVLQMLSQHGIDLVAEECTNPADVVDVASDADAIWLFGGSRVITAECLPLLPRCSAILRTGSGADNVPLAEATAAGIVVATTPEAGAQSVAEHALALILAALRQITTHDRLVRVGTWDRAEAWPRALRGRVVGLIGFGLIARALSRVLAGFDVSCIAHDPFVSDDVFAAHGVSRRTLAEVLSQSHVVSLHAPLTDQTHHLIGEAELRAMREDAILINTARGSLVDEPALRRALSEGWISGAGLDVLDREPTEPDNPLLQLGNAIITPHIAALSETYFDESWRLSVETLIDLASGRWPRSCANGDVTPRRRLVHPTHEQDPARVV